MNRDGQWGLFAGTGGLGLRHWTSDRLALELATDFAWRKDTGYFGDTKNVGVSLGLVPAFTVTGNLRFEGIARLGYFRDHNKQDETNFEGEETTNSYTSTVGLGVEYYFDELPRLTFGANLVGAFFQYSEHEHKSVNNGTSVETKSYPKYFDTFSDVTASVTYYF